MLCYIWMLGSICLSPGAHLWILISGWYDVITMTPWSEGLEQIAPTE